MKKIEDSILKAYGDQAKANVDRMRSLREELLLKPDVLQKMWVLRKLCYPMDDLEAMEFLLDKVKSTKGNAEFFDAMRRG